MTSTLPSTAIDQVPRQLFINGEWVDAAADHTFVVYDPADGTRICEVADARAADGAAALDAAVAAQEAWGQTSPRFRANILRRTYDLIQERRELFAEVMTREMGKPLRESRTEVDYGSEFLRWFSEEAVRIAGRYGSNPEGTGTMVVSKRPVGPCLLITPWNFPLAMGTRKIGPALAAGCTVVIKPPELTPLTMLLLVATLEEAGLPKGVVNVITTSRSREVCTPLIADERLRKLSFTGSTGVGKQLLKQAADTVLRTSMELGGNAPFLVFEDADIEAAVTGAMLAKFRNTGQACTAANRFLVHESVAEDFAAQFSARVTALQVGSGLDEQIDIGPLIEPGAVRGAREFIDDAVARGARVAAGGSALEGPGNFLQPTVLVDVPREARVLQEEIFAPIAPIITFTSDDQAIALANATEYGLVGYAYTASVTRTNRLIRDIQTGMLGINTGVVSNAAAPFGGVKQSGLGREGGLEGLDEYLDTKDSLISGG